MSQVDREFKKDIRELYKKYMDSDSYVTAIHLFDRMVSMSRYLGVDTVSDEKREELLYYMYLYSNNNAIHKLSTMITELNDLVNELKYDLMRKQLWNIEEGESSPAIAGEDDKPNEEDKQITCSH